MRPSSPPTTPPTMPPILAPVEPAMVRPGPSPLPCSGEIIPAEPPGGTPEGDGWGSFGWLFVSGLPAGSAEDGSVGSGSDGSTFEVGSSGVGATAD